MTTLIPWEKVMEKHMQKPGFAEGVERARRELEAELAVERQTSSPNYDRSHEHSYGAHV